MIYKYLTFTIILLILSLSPLIAQNGISAKLIETGTLSGDASKPQYIGGESELYKFLENNIRYPYILAQIEMEGEVDVKFTIGKEGKIKNVEIVRGFDPLADEEVVKVIKALSEWNPAEIGGEAVEMDQVITINFTLNDELISQAKKMKEEGAKDNSYIGSSFIMEEIAENELTELKGDTYILNMDDPLNKVPQFPGGQEALTAYFKNNLKYPKRAIQMGIEGRVIFKLQISAEGEITKMMLYKSIFRDCDEEAFYLVKKMPKWNPGLKDGKPVDMEVMVPIPFVLPT